MSNYDSLLNNVPPNVSLQRSANAVPDSQLSPGFTPNIMQQQLSPSPARAPFSPQSNQSYQPYTNTGQRLSPQQQMNQQQQINQQQQQQQQMTFQTGTNTSSNAQLSPRQLPFTQGTPNSQQTQPNQPQNPQQQQQQWNQSALNSRLSVQQQQNPMLNAQLQASIIVHIEINFF